MQINNSIRFLSVTAVAMVSLAACSEKQEKPNLNLGLSGTIQVRIVQYTRVSQGFEINMRDQTPARITFQRTSVRSPGPQIESCTGGPVATAADGKYFVTCHLGAESSELTVIRSVDKSVAYKKTVKGKLTSLIWSSNGDDVAFLVQVVKVSPNPYYLLYLLSGHPKQFESYRVIVVNVQSGEDSSIVIPGDVVASYGQFLDWIQAEK